MEGVTGGPGPASQGPSAFRRFIGIAADPLFKQLSAATGQAPRWNFHKYVITPGAAQVYSFNTRVEPDAPEIMNKLALIR